ncbi:MAG: oligopeptide transporter, OPT family [Gracilimonas sp.]|uniref:OPT family oligopeptide transporter n=1 Tax=Gracilimonas TaxID=649462 RepID=UPI001B0BEA78|nr:oligopeptide transporter, OPT family [Gracilimonas sp.]MBO6587377.1 oligopeptide transporter, OPT family [Gracilimonas sp.]MBO6614137.1 oligopeptide transporter, OPT family [Gracilimonas sp.]
MSKKGFTPFVSAEDDLPQITVKAVVLGFVLSAILAGANAYLGLKVGMTVSASIPAAVISMAVLKLFKESNILENNIVQTAASAGESLAAGVIFTLPALILLKYWLDFPFMETAAIAMFGGILGVLFTIPLRRALIVESELQFPEGVATGEVLKAGTEGGAGIKTIIQAGVAAALFKLSQTGLKVFAGSVGGSVKAGKSIFGMGADLSVALLAVGYIVGLNIAVLIFAGGLISWLFGIPIYMAVTSPEEISAIVGAAEGYDAALAIWSQKIRYLGVGAMVVGGVWALISLAKPLVDGIKSSMAAVKELKNNGSGNIPRTELDTPINIVVWGILGLSIPIFIVFTYVIDIEHLAVSGGAYWTAITFGVVFSLFAGFLFSSVAGYMAGLVGSSNNPISGVTIATVLATSLCLLAILGSQVDFTADMEKATTAAAAAIIVGAMIACAAALAGDNLQDLKAGQLVGATPYKQQIMQVVGVVAAALVIAPILSLLFNAYGLGGVFPREGMNPEEMLTAPQATLMQSVAEGVFARNLEWGMIIIGGLIAVAIIILDQILKRKGTEFRTPVLAVAVGIYLPVELSVPIFLGGMIAWTAARFVKNRAIENGESPEEAETTAERKGLLFSSGLITGEALIGIILAIPFALFESTDALRIMPEGFGWLTDVLGVGAAVCFMIWLYKVAVKKGE